MKWKFIKISWLAALAAGLLCAAALVPAALHAQTVSFAGVQTTAPASGLRYPSGVAVDGAGDLFISDNGNNRVVKVTPGGVQTTVPASGLDAPYAVAVDGAGDVFISEPTRNDRVVKVTPAGVQTTVPASGLGDPFGVAVDGAGDVFIADAENSRVVKVTPGGVQTTVPASGLGDPFGLAVDGAGDVFISDIGNGDVLEVTPGGVQSTVADSLSLPRGVVVDGAGDVFIADSSNNRVVKVTPGGVQTTVGFGLSNPTGVAVDGAGDVFISDRSNNRVVEVQTQSVNFGSANICPAGQTTPAPCSQTITLNYDVTASVTLGTPQVLTGGAPNLDFTLASASTCTGSVTAGSACTVNVTFTPRLAGARNGAVEILDGSGNVLATSLVYGTGTGPQIAFAPATQSTIGGGLNYPRGVAVDGAGDVFIADSFNNRVVEVTPGGVQTTVPASGLYFPFGLAVDGAGDVFIADSFNARVVEVTPLGVQTTVPASGLYFPTGVAVDGAGDVFIADSMNNRVVEVTPLGVQTTVPASGLGFPHDVAVDGAGDVFIADYNNNRVVEVTPGGVQTTVPASGLSHPYGVAVDGVGDVFISDASDARFVEVTPGGVQTTLPASGLSGASGIALDGAGDFFIADPANNRVVKLNRSTPPALAFATTPVGKTSSDSPQSVTIQNTGNASLSLTGLSVAANFGQVDGSGNPEDCTASTSLASGAECNLSLSFTPTTAGTIQGSAVLSDNALNGNPATQTINLNGTATDVVASFGITGLVSTTAGTGENFTITALDPQGNVYTGFSGTVSISSSDPQAEAGESSVTLTNGVKSLTDAWKFLTAGYQTLTVTDSADSIISTSAPVLITAATASSLAAVQGSGQTATVNTAFATPLQVIVKDQYGNPVSGATVTFTAPSSGASATLSAAAVTAADGTTSVTATANATAGSYNINAASAHTQSVRFTLANSLATQTINFPQPASPITYSAGLTVTLTATSTSNLAVTYSVSGPATVSGSALTVTGAGTVVVTANQAGNSTYAPATAVQDTIVVNPASQTVNFTGLPLTATFGSAGPYTLNASSTGGGTSTYSVTGPASITGSTLTINGAGTVIVTASFAATTNYTAASASQTIQVSSASQTVNFTGLPLTATFGSAGPYTLNASSTGGGTPTYSVTGPASITGSTLTINGAGTVIVTASFAATTNYTAASASQTIVVSAASQTVNFTGLPLTATFGSAGPYTLNASSTGGGTPTYSVTGPGSITGSTLTINGAGTVIVTASFAATTNYTAASASQTIQVSAASQTVNFTGLPLTATFGSAGPYTLNASSTGGGTSTYSVTGPASITGSTLTINGAGTVIVTASFAATTNYTAASASQTIQVSSASQTVNFTGLPLTATFGSAGPYTLNASSTGGGTPTYSVTGPGSITGSTLTINGAGTVIVTASFAATTNYTAASASQTIQVSAASQTVNFTGLPLTATFGSAGPYTLNGTASSGLAVSYNVGGPATITGSTLTIIGPGTVIVTASQAGNGNYSAAVPVSQTIIVSAPVSPYDAAISVQYASTQLVYPGATNITVCIAPAHNITATGSVQIFDGTTLLATISVQGGGCAYWYISPGLAAGNHVLTAVYSGDKNNPAGTSAPTTVSVAPVPVKLAPNCWLTNTGYGANYQCTVSLSSNAGSAQGVMTYSYDGAPNVSVPVNNGTANFTLTRPAAGNHSVVIAYAQQTNYAAAGPITENFTVLPAAVNVQLTPSSWSTSASAGISFAATVNSSSAGAPNGNGSVGFFDGGTLLATVPVNANGQASYSSTSLTAGSHTITATYSGGVNYASGSSSVSITLTK